MTGTGHIRSKTYNYFINYGEYNFYFKFFKKQTKVLAQNIWLGMLNNYPLFHLTIYMIV